MNLSFLLGLLRGTNVWETVAKILTIGGGFVAGLDADKKGSDDLIADIMISAADGLTAYGRKDYNKVGNIIDSVIAGLQKLKAQLIASGVVVLKGDLP